MSQEKRKLVRKKVHVPIVCWEESAGRESGKGKEIVSKDISGEGLAFFSDHETE